MYNVYDIYVYLLQRLNDKNRAIYIYMFFFLIIILLGNDVLECNWSYRKTNHILCIYELFYTLINKNRVNV